MTKYKKSIFKTLKIVLGVLLLLYLGIFIYVSLHKKSIILQVTEEIGKKMNGKVSFGDVELSFFRHFPTVSVLLHDVRITDSMYAQHKHVFFHAKQVFAGINIMSLIKKRSPLSGLNIVKGQVYLFTDSSGYSNTYLYRQKKDSVTVTQPTGKLQLRSIQLHEVAIIIDDRYRNKLHNLFVNELDMKLDADDSGSVVFKTDADILVHSLGFRLSRGSYLKEKKLTGRFDLKFNKPLNQLQFDHIAIKLSGQPFRLSGRFDLGMDNPQFSLEIDSKKILYADGKSMLTDRIARSLSMVELDKPLDVHASLKGPLKGGDPLIHINWEATKTQLNTPFLDFQQATFTGSFTNEVVKGIPRDDPNSRITLTGFSADWHGMALHSHNIEINDLSKPVLTCDLATDFPLKQLNELVGSTTLQLLSGDGSVNITYKGPLQKNSETNSLLNGSVSFKNGVLLYGPRDVEMKNVNGLLSFKNSDVFVENLQCEVLNNKVVMQGKARNLLSLINTEPDKITVDWNITSPSLNVASFIYLLKPAKKTSSAAKKNSSLASVASKIDDVLEKASLHVNLDASKLYYKKFEAAKVNADISLLEDRYIINNLSMNHSGGSVNLKGNVSRRNNGMQADIKVIMDNVNVQNVFNSFDNFGQDGILGKNLEGQLSTNIDASLLMDDKGNVVPSSIQSNIDFSLVNGALINYEPVKKLQNILFKKRDFENIRFAELKNRLEIRNREIKINRMEIQSSVLSFFAEGVYSTKGNTDISIQVPLNNLKKRDADYNPENIGTDKKGGRSLFLRGRPGSDGNVDFKIDLFNKYKKEKLVK